jgi:ribosomal protein L11 methyltransferase
MVWAELLIDAPEAAAEAVAAYVGLRGGGVEIRDQGTLLKPRPGRSLLVAWSPPADAERWVADLLGRFGGVSVEVRLRDEAEWRDVWKQYFKPRRVGRRLVVCPSWETFAAQSGDVVIELDPGRAFGTGTHESTQLVLAAMEDLAPPRAVLDVGCGSGILSIAAGRLWPQASLVALDVDPEAVACARENLARNGVRAAVSTSRVGEVAGEFELVLANIQAEVLLDLVAPLSARVAAGGTLILSGLLGDQAQDVAARYALAGLRILHFADRGEWRVAVLRR